MLSHPTKPNYALVSAGVPDVAKPQILLDTSTVHFILPKDHAAIKTVRGIARASELTRSFLMLEIDGLKEEWCEMFWLTEHADSRRNRHGFKLSVSKADIHHAGDPTDARAELSFGSFTKHELHPRELERFGLSGGSLGYEGTRTLKVWRRVSHRYGAGKCAALLYEQTGLGSYAWMRSYLDDVVNLYTDNDESASE